MSARRTHHHTNSRTKAASASVSAKPSVSKKISKNTHPKFGSFIPAIAIVVFIFNVALFAYIQYKSNVKPPIVKDTPIALASPTVTPTSTPTPYPLPQGEQIFYGSTSADAKGPKLTQVKINPYDPTIGIDQKYTIKASNENAIKSVTLDLVTDSKKTSHIFKQIESEGINSTWEVTIPTNDTHFYIYSPTIIITDSTGQPKKFEMTLRAY